MKKNKAFTLAEVLITLGIIGVVAAMTIPTLMQKVDERETVSKLKKFYSTIQRAYSLAKIENGEFGTWFSDEDCSGQAACANKMANVFSQYFKVSKVCHDNQGCFANATYKKLSGQDFDNLHNLSTVSKLVTNDGFSVYFYKQKNELQGQIGVDINGDKGPNTFGKDTFNFLVYEDKIVPFGSYDSGTYGFPQNCNINNCSSICEACASWIIYNENMDYLHCSDLSWNGKTKCN